MRDVLDTTPAYVVTTTATNARGTQYGDMRHVITAGQLAQHVLHLEPHTRAAQRIAQGRHDAHVRTTDQFKAQLVYLPVNVRVTSTVEPAAINAAIAQDRAAAADYRRAVAAHADHGHDEVVEAADAWVARRMDALALGLDGLAALPAELAEALALIERSG